MGQGLPRCKGKLYEIGGVSMTFGHPATGDHSILTQQMAGYRLTTADILYHMPDHPNLLQTYLWQELDLAPKFPVLKKFLDFWETNLDGRLHSVQVAHKGVVSPSTYRFANGVMTLH